MTWQAEGSIVKLHGQRAEIKSFRTDATLGDVDQAYLARQIASQIATSCKLAEAGEFAVIANGNYAPGDQKNYIMIQVRQIVNA